MGNTAAADLLYAVQNKRISRAHRAVCAVETMRPGEPRRDRPDRGRGKTTQTISTQVRRKIAAAKLDAIQKHA